LEELEMKMEKGKFPTEPSRRSAIEIDKQQTRVKKKTSS